MSINKELQHSLDEVLEAIKEGKIPRKVIEAYKSSMDKAHISNLKENDHVFKSRLDLQMGLDAYKYALEQGVAPEEALKHIQVIHTLTDEFIKEAKNNQFRGHTASKEIVRKYDRHPRQKRMIEEGTMDRGTLISAKTPNQQLGRLHRQTILDERLSHLTSRVNNQEIELATIFKTLEDNDICIDKVEMACYLKNKGYTLKQIAEHYLVSVKTIQRWLNK